MGFSHRQEEVGLMSFPKSDKIWMNGKLVPWDDARIHIGSHVIHYGSAVFEGIRCYATPPGSIKPRLSGTSPPQSVDTRPRAG